MSNLHAMRQARVSAVKPADSANLPGPVPGPEALPAPNPEGRPGASAARPRFPRAPAMAVLLLAALLAAVFASLLVGARPIAPGTVLDALLALDPANGDHAVVASRIPRTLAAIKQIAESV